MKHVFVVQTAGKIEESSMDEFRDGTNGISEQSAVILLLERLFKGGFVCSEVNQSGKNKITIPNALTSGAPVEIIT